MFLKYFKLINKLQNRHYCTKLPTNNKVYSSTVLLPKTKFPLKLENKKLVERDKNIYKVAAFEELYFWQRKHLLGPEFILHDGPPYANGKPHMGHAINKILKDTILRYKMLDGNKVHFVPGWDCHGLPIELKALSDSSNLNAIEIRTKAHKFAQKTVEEQKETFKSWGVLGDWKNSYTTYSVDYVKNQLEVFYKLYKKGLIFRDVKPIYWSPSSRTALAEAELEYNESHQSPSAYVRVQIKDIPQVPMLKDKCVYAIIWTTTPWTLPSNQAVCYNKTLSYSLVKKPDPEDKDLYIIASELLEDVSKATDIDFQLLGVHSGDMLSEATYIHPIYEKVCNFFHSSHATANKGTGLVHTAPAHGPDDFLVALDYKLPIVDLVDETGRYKPEAGKNLEGKFVLDEGNKYILELKQKDLIHVSKIKHSYPYDWRTKKPIIIRASQQWFINTDAIKNKAIELLEDVTIIPKDKSDVYKKNLIAQVKKRPYWCISRQRKWGVPIPVFYNKISKEIVINEDLIHHICQLLEKYGTDFWWKLSMEELLPRSFRERLGNLEKAEDILDIWFDSGISWSKVLEGEQVADVYLEGVDQFTGWFQSALLTSVGLRGKAPYKTIYVHGFAVDENGVKMSKSIGNVVDPVDVTDGKKGQKPFGVDTLRWWVACHANHDSMAYVSTNVLQSSADEVQKIRSVLRFALGSIYDFKLDGVEKLLLIDRYMLHLLYQFHIQTKESISEYNYHKICISVINLLTNSVSALYYTSIKDRLYCDIENNSGRRAAQYVLLQIFEIVSQSIAGIVPHFVEEMYMHLPEKENDTYFTSNHLKPAEIWQDFDIEKAMAVILNIKKQINKELGPKTADAIANIRVSEENYELLKSVLPIETVEEQLVDILQISQGTLQKDTNVEDFKLDIRKSECFSCPRCRRVHSFKQDELCNRCTNVIDILNENKTIVAN